MNLHTLTIDEQRSYARKALESLEHWLRRLVHEELSKSFGADYILAKNPAGDYIFKKEIRQYVTSRLNSEPSRYPRSIDATTLDHLIRIVCNGAIYKTHFSAAFREAYPLGREEALFFLDRIYESRNRLSHANNVAVRNIERILCYTNDIIDSLKSHYKTMNQSQEYNAPTVLRVVDSIGNEAIDEQIRRNNTGRGICNWSQSDVFVGDTISIEVDVDPSFLPESYSIQWITSSGDKVENSNRFSLEVENRHVRHDFCIYAKITSTEDWHRCGDCDDSVGILYKIRPR